MCACVVCVKERERERERERGALSNVLNTKCAVMNHPIIAIIVMVNVNNES